MPANDPQWLARQLLPWFDRHGRFDLPWQRPRSRYRVWVSEIMLQQTQVQTVIGYFQRFVEALPSLPDLAAASQDEVLALWSGLGYYSRARNLHAAAQVCMQQHNAQLPGDQAALMALPGIGRSTAAAILAQADGLPLAILDGNVKRVLARFHAVQGWPGRSAVSQQLWQLAEAHTPLQRCADYTQAIMDLGATICRRQKPDCPNCPLAARCMARQQQRQLELPERKPRKQRPLRQRIVLLSRIDDHWLLQRRPPSGLWGGLFSPLIGEDRDNLLDTLAAYQPQQPERRSELDFEHAFSHFQLQAEVWQVRLNAANAVADDQLRLMSTQQALASGLPAPIRRLFNAL